MEGYHIISLRDLDGLRMPFAPLYRSLPDFARCFGGYYRPSMPLQAIKSEEASYDPTPDFHNSSSWMRAGNWQVNGM